MGEGSAGRRAIAGAREAILSIEIVLEPLDGSRLVRDYQSGDPVLAGFFTGGPRDPAAYERKAREVAARFDPERRRAMRAAIRATSPGAEERLAAVVERGGFFVTTGQQAGFLTGPLYTVYKVLTAVRLAAALERHLGVPVAPLFWVASEDHDWEEVSVATVIDAANRLHELRLPGPGAPSLEPMSRRILDPGISEVIAELAGLLPPTEFTEDLLAVIRRAYVPGRSVAAAFEEMIADLFADFHLLTVDAGHPALKAMSAPILARELERAAEHEAKVAAHTARLEAAGYEAQVPVHPGAANVFYHGEGGRHRILRADDGGFRLRGSDAAFGRDELLARVRAEPERFSPNVLLRPIVESAVFPTLAYVAGPGELAYFAQIGCLFQAHGCEMPIVYPRASITLVERKVRKVLDKYHLGLDDVRVPAHELANRVAREGLPEPVSAALARIAAGIDAGYGELLEAAVRIDPTLRGPVDRARNASHKQLRDIEAKIVQLARKQQEIQLEQLTKAAVNLYPGGSPQERVLNVVPYLARYGRGLLAAIAEAIRVELTARSPAWSGVRCGDRPPLRASAG